MPSMDWMGSSSSSVGQLTLNVESDPPGADVRASTGASCRTPCALAVDASASFSVNLSLNGYLPQSVPVKLIPPEDPRFTAEGTSVARLDPNPIFVELERAPPPAPPAKKKPVKKRPAQRPAVAPPPTSAGAAPQPAPPVAQPAPAGVAPWPMPR